MLTRNLEKAKQAFKHKNIEETKRAHHAKRHEPHGASGKYVKSFVYGGLDGIITTFAIVAGVAGASLAAKIVLILGFANLLADGLSMAIGDYLSTKAENDYNKTERERETWEVEHYPEGEKKEMMELYREKGVPEEDARQVVEILSKHKTAWVDVMMKEELGIIEDGESPAKNAVVTFVAFTVFGFIPLLTYVIANFVPSIGDYNFLFASVLTGITLFLLGALKSKVVGTKWYNSGIEMLLVGGIAAVAAYFVGVALGG
ncbi:MAG: VIT1/CCC1 transporter family protein [Nanoarchaeota archaeon]|nr:VIT1/CCC1 transporter family protein [Nanoarchaeota archaeon]